MAYNVSSKYEQIIYSQSEKNKIKILFNGVRLENAGEYCEKFSVKSKLFADDGNKVFRLNDFVAREAELILHNVPLTQIVSPITIQIGTLVGNNPLVESDYEWIPMGIFNIQDNPTTDKDKITIKLRDNAVKFDFKYNAEPLIKANGGKATKKQILLDICSKAGVQTNITSFLGDSDYVGTYDNTINGRIYIAMIAEQAGCIATIDRTGKLIFVNLNRNTLHTWYIDLGVVEKYEIGKKFYINRVVYESGEIKYETSSDETLDTLYLDASNTFINSQTQVNNIYNKLKDFSVDSVTTGKILGNPAIDAYDLISIKKGTEVIFTTLANNEYVFNGVHRHKFETEIGLEERKENVTLRGEPTFKKWAKTEIDNIKGTVTTTVGKVETLEESIEMLATEIETNVVVIPVDKDKKPISSGSTSVNYTVKFIGSPITLRPTTTSTATGITCTIQDDRITFTVDSTTAIPQLVNNFTFNWSKTIDGQTFYSLKKIAVSLVQRGADGAKGDTGAAGKDGTNGKDGAKGDTGAAGTGVTKIQQLYFSKNNTTAPAAPTSAITSTSTGSNVWTTAIPLYNASYPYYFTCTQTLYSNGSYGWSAVTRDGATESAIKTANEASTQAGNAVSTANTAKGNADTALNTVNNMQIGGRNLLRLTKELGNYNGETNPVGVTFDPEVSFQGNTACYTQLAWRGPYMNLKKIGERCDLKVGDVVTASQWIMFDSVPTKNVGFTWYRVYSANNPNYVIDKNNIVAGKWFRISLTATLTDYSFTVENSRIETNYYEDSTNYSFSQKMYISSPKLEKGNKATDWTPAPEDIDENIGKINVNYSGLITRMETVEETTTTTSKTIEVIQEAGYLDTLTGEVKSIKTSTGYTFDEQGLNIHKSDTTFNTQIDYEKMQHKDGNSTITETSKNGFMTTNLRVKAQHYYGWNGSSYEFVAEELVEEKGYAHYYNGGV